MAQGLVIVAALATLAVLVRVAWRSAPGPAREPVAACRAPVEVDDDAGARVLCAGNAELGSCDRLSPGDRVLLARGGGCRRVEGGMQAKLRMVYGLPLDINRATADELRLLEGVGPKLAQAIVEDRARNGRFGATADLRRVRGIGPTLLQRIAASIMVVDATDAPPLRPPDSAVPDSER